MKHKNTFVIIVTYNGMQWIKKCLEDVLSSSVHVRVIVIDNGSTDGTIDFIEKNPRAELVKAGANLGFGKANNIGIKKAMEAGADYVFLLNQDGYVVQDTIQKLISFQQTHPDYGVLSPQQMNGDGSEQDKSFKNIVLSKKCIISSFKEINTTIYNVYFVMAAFWLVSIECLKKVGLFDPIFFHYGEDSDYLSRVRYHKYKIGIVMDSIGYHDRSERNVPYPQQIKIYYVSQLAELTNINRSFFLCLAKVLYHFVKRCIMYGSKLDFELLATNNKAFFDLLTKINRVLVSRKRNKQPARILLS